MITVLFQCEMMAVNWNRNNSEHQNMVSVKIVTPPLFNFLPSECKHVTCLLFALHK